MVGNPLIIAQCKTSVSVYCLCYKSCEMVGNPLIIAQYKTSVTVYLINPEKCWVIHSLVHNISAKLQ